MRWKCLLPLAASTILGLAPPGPAAAQVTCDAPQIIDFPAGIADNFAPPPPTEAASPSTEFAAFLGSPAPVFDQTNFNRRFGHTFANLPTGIIGATLTIRLRALPVAGVDNDGLLLEFSPGPSFAWSQTIAALAALTWRAPDQAELTLDLAALPPSGTGVTNILAALADGDLDVFVQDDTAVDFVTLRVTHCLPPPCAEVPSGLVGWWPLDETSGTTAADLAGLNHGAHVNGPVPGPGQVAGALSFDGVDDHVLVADSTPLDIGTADFTVDAWVFAEKDTLIKPIVDKMDLATRAGYSLSLVAGNVMTFAWGDASGFTFTHSSSGTPIGNPQVPVGVWTHVAVTLDRDDPAGGKFYIDGALVNSFNPTFKPGSFASAAPLRIGAGGIFNNGFFDGSIDEVEIFNRALDASEINALYQAGPFGKCKDSLQPGWDYSICPDEATTIARPKVCNDSSAPHEYSLSFTGVAGGSPGVPGGCTGQGPTSFALVPPDTLPLLVPPGTCREVQVTVGKAANQGISEQRCFKIVAQNLDTGVVVQDFSSLYAPRDLCGAAAPGNPEIWFDPRPVVFTVRNPGASPVIFDYEFEAVASSMEPEDLITVLDGLELGDRVTGQVTIPARRSVALEVLAALFDDGTGRAFQAFNDQDVLLRLAGTNVVLASESLRPTPPGCVPTATELCLNNGRFRVNAAWRVGSDTGLGQAVPLTSDTGYFWFFGPQNVEVVLKVLDGRPLNEHFWVFYGALSDVEYVLTVTDTETGASKTYFNPAGNLASVADTSAIPAAAGSTVSDVEEDEAAIASAAAAAQAELDALLATAPVGTCAPDATALCLQDARFRVEVEWKDFVGNTGVGQAVPLTSDTGYFWFFGPDNVELILKVLDGRPLNQRWWVFYGALSSVEYRIVVTDTETGNVKTYFNPSGTLASVADTNAFP